MLFRSPVSLTRMMYFELKPLADLPSPSERRQQSLWQINCNSVKSNPAFVLSSFSTREACGPSACLHRSLLCRNKPSAQLLKSFTDRPHARPHKLVYNNNLICIKCREVRLLPLVHVSLVEFVFADV